MHMDSANKCSWAGELIGEKYGCNRERYKESEFCLLHSPQENKSVEDFTKELKKALASGDERIALNGIVFPRGDINLEKP